MRALALVALAGCATGGMNTMSAGDNDPATLKRVLAGARKPAPVAPRNVTGKPLVFVVGDGHLIAWNLADRRVVWTQKAAPDGRIVVGKRLIAAREKTALVARAADTGREVWRHTLPDDKLIGVAADEDRFYYVTRSGGDGVATGLDEKGVVAWRGRASGELGAPAADRGLVFVPYNQQWLTLVDGKTGQAVTRLRCNEETVTYVRAGADGVVYGSRGAFFLDEHAAAGKAAGATYARPPLPDFVKPMLGPDGYQPMAAAYSAMDRARVLWRARVDAAGHKLGFAGGGPIALHFRYWFAVDDDGRVKWARREARDVASAEHLGDAIVYVTAAGEIAVLDTASGKHAVLGQLDKKLAKRVSGATFDAAGWKAPAGTEPTALVPVLSQVARDRDARFASVKRWAADALGNLPEDTGGVTAALVEIARDRQSSREVVLAAGTALVRRVKPGDRELLAGALKERADHLRGTSPRGVGAIARAAAVHRQRELVPLLVAHLEDPATPAADLGEVAAALGAFADRSTFPALANLLLLHRADPAYMRDPGPFPAVAEAVIAVGGAEGRALVAHVAADARTADAVAEAARKALVPSAGHGTLEGGRTD